MHLLTWHGTLVCLKPQGGGLAQSPIAGPANGQTLLDLALPKPEPEPVRVQTALGPLYVAVATAGPGINVSRYGKFLSADAGRNAVAFDRAAAALWEVFLPLTADDLARLRHILAHRWMAADGRQPGPVAAALSDGFLLVLGGSGVAVAQVLAGGGPDGRAPDALVIAQGGDMLTFKIAGEVPVVVVAGPASRESAVPGAPAGDDHARLVAVAQDYAGDARSGLALAAFRRVATAYPGDAQAWFRVGQLLHDAGAYGGARAAWERCRAAAPSHAGAASRLAALAGSLGRKLEAAALFEAAVAGHPADAETRVQLAGAYTQLDWLDRAAEAFAAITPPLAGWKEAARRRLLRRLERERGALAQAAAGGAADADSPAAPSLGTPSLGTPSLGKRARSSFRVGALADCEAAIDGLLAQDPDRLEPHLLRAAVLARRSGAQAAWTYLQAQQDRFGESVDFRVAVMRWRQADGLYGPGQARLEASLRDDPRGDAFELLATATLARGNSAGLLRIAGAWLRHHGTSTAAASFAIEAARQAGRIARLDDILAAPAFPLPGMVQFWDTTPPPDVAGCLASWPRQHPGLAHVVFDAAGARAFLAKSCAPAVLDAYEAAHHPAMQSDILRLGYLSVHGGIYVDADDACLRDMRRVFAALAQVEVFAVQSGEAPPYMFNGFIGARPGCAVIAEALAEAARLVLEQVGRGSRPDIWQTTGPGVLTRAIGRYVLQEANAGRVLLLTAAEYGVFARTRDDLVYKVTSSGDWRLN